MKSVMEFLNRLNLSREFYSGVLSSFDISGGGDDLPDWTRGPERDAAALRGDWERIGGDIRKAMECALNE